MKAMETGVLMPTLAATDAEAGTNLVSSLLPDQAPDLHGRPFRFVAAGWDNAIYRLGDGLAIRLPRKPMAAVLNKRSLWQIRGYVEHVASSAAYAQMAKAVGRLDPRRR
ncbi:MAG: hypothetical protein R3F18_09890 [Lysobacterales bacterium]